MGLLDALFQPQNYGGQSAGLLDLLQRSQMQQDQYQPSQGFQPLPGASRPQAPAQAAPIMVGSTQMPRTGAADLYSPSQAALPPNATPTQGQMVPPQQDGALPPALGGMNFGGNLGAGLQSFVNTPGGLLPKLLGGINAGITGQRSDPVGLQQQNLKAQFDATRQALIDNGVEPRQAASTAMLAVLNPEAAKTVIPELLTNKEKYQVVSEDPLEGKKYGFVNERDQTVNGRPMGQAQGAGNDATGGLQQLSDTLGQMQQSGASREQMLQQIPAAYRGYVDSVLSGKALPSNLGRAQARGTIMALAHSIDRNFDETTIPLRTKTATDYAPNGQSGRSIVALNTVQHHIGKLSDDLENLGDTGFTPLNALRNSIAVNTGLEPKQGKAIQAVQDDLKAVTDEMSAAYKAGRVSDHEIEAWNKLANSNLPLRQLKQGIFDFVGLLNGKRDQLNETHTSILGTEAPGINRDLNEAITKKVTDRNSDKAISTSASSKPKTVIQNGHTYVLQSDGSYK